MEERKRCNCRTCEYGREIQALADRQATPEDKRRIERLYESFALEEDDNGMYRGRWTAMKDVLCLIRKDHFLSKGYDHRLDGHEECRLCELLTGLR
jgi:hypothetical protein